MECISLTALGLSELFTCRCGGVISFFGGSFILLPYWHFVCGCVCKVTPTHEAQNHADPPRCVCFHSSDSASALLYKTTPKDIGGMYSSKYSKSREEKLYVNIYLLSNVPWFFTKDFKSFLACFWSRGSSHRCCFESFLTLNPPKLRRISISNRSDLKYSSADFVSFVIKDWYYPTALHANNYWI